MSKYILLILLLSTTISCQTKTEKKPEKIAVSKPKIASVNYPLHFFTMQIGGDHIDAIFPIPEDIDPAFYNPDSRALEQFQAADIIFLNGAGYADWVDKVSLSDRKMINTSASFSDKYIIEEGTISHSHGPEGEHAHANNAFTTWLDLSNALEQARAIYATLRTLSPYPESAITANFDQLEAELQALQINQKKLLDPFMNATIFASHPVYQYLGSGYGLNIKSEHWEPEQDIGEDDWISFIEKVNPADLRLMLWEDEPTQQTRNRLESFGIHIVVYRPCGNVPDRGNFLEVMSENINNLRSGLDALNFE